MSAPLSDLRSSIASSKPHKVADALKLPILGSNRSFPVERIDKSSWVIDSVDWSNVATKWQQAASKCAAGKELVECYQAQASLHETFNHLFGNSAGNWLVPALHTICLSTHKAAMLADKSKGRSGSNKHQQNAVTILQTSFSQCMNHRVEYQPNAPFSENGSKKAGVLYIVNQLFAIYFRVNNLRLCKNLQKPVEGRKLHLTGRKGDLVTYRYYVGRLHMFEDQYDLAETHLEYAFQHCHRTATRNKRCILTYLVPVKLYRGRFATHALLQKYGLEEYIPLVDSIRTGDLRNLNVTLQRHQDLFIRRGVYLLLESKCKTICYRNLFKRIHFALDKPSHVNLKEVAHALKWLGLGASGGVGMELDEVECILANLIYRKYIRGYISHSKRVLVLSKSNPFPTSEVIKS